MEIKIGLVGVQKGNLNEMLAFLINFVIGFVNAQSSNYGCNVKYVIAVNDNGDDTVVSTNYDLTVTDPKYQVSEMCEGCQRKCKRSKTQEIKPCNYLPKVS